MYSPLFEMTFQKAPPLMSALRICATERLHIEALIFTHALKLGNNPDRDDVSDVLQCALEPPHLGCVAAAQDVVLESSLHLVVDIEILDDEPVALQWRQRLEVLQALLVEINVFSHFHMLEPSVN
jgi:hypothetical protein